MPPEDDVVLVDPDEETIGCDGGDGPLGHPMVYYSFGTRREIMCNYCGRRFVKAEEPGAAA